eukprot:2360514-Pleurochrysis_carterae.AAC.1
MLSLPHGTVVDGVVAGESLAWQGVRVWIALFATGGFRKEAVALGPGEQLDALLQTHVGGRSLLLRRRSHTRPLSRAAPGRRTVHH